MMRAILVALAFVAGCSDDTSPAEDLAVAAHDMAVSDLGPSACPPTFSAYGAGTCRGNTVCRYPSDAGPYDHMRCNGSAWQPGNCPFGPGYATQFSGCIGSCYEFFGEAYTSCECRPDGVGICCVDTGGNCSNFDFGL